ncbi:MAG: hypothetical protein CMJ81_01920 [Planctomycetaceae bacterium]|nr:hypothetical protein [Planctomycetaceae bacterium]
MKLVGKSFVCLAFFALTIPAQADPLREESLSPEQFNKAHKSLFTPEKSQEAGALTERLLKDQSALRQAAATPVERRNFVDEFIFSKMERDGVPHAPLTSDIEFLRRATLDLTGRVPSPQEIRDFVDSEDADKRDTLIDRLIDSEAWVEKWTYFFMDLFRANGKMGRGRFIFHYWMKENLRSDRPYNDVVQQIITASAKSNHVVAAANLIAREHVQGAPHPEDGDDLSMVHQLDTHDELSIIYYKAFLGMNLSCISCHDGQGHVDQVNVWLSNKTRGEFFQNAAFFGRSRYLMYWENGMPQSNEFLIDDHNPGYDTEGHSMIRVARLGGSKEPAFLLSAENPAPGEEPRDALARMLTSHKQFPRATANMFWARLMSVGIVEPYNEFDLSRQDPESLPEGWQLQPSHPKLLDALADDFEENGYRLKHLMKTICKSNTYQLSARFPGEWKASYTNYFARKFARRLTAEELHDVIVLATERPAQFEQAGKTYGLAMQLAVPSGDRDTKHFMRIFGQSDRQTPAKLSTGSMQHPLVLMQSSVVNQRVLAEKESRLQRLLENYPQDDSRVIEEMFLASLSRWPSEREKEVALSALVKDRVEGSQDLQWALINSVDFFFNY